MSATIRFDEAWSRKVEAIYATPDMAAQRLAVLRLLAPRRGERILDVGAGPGFLTQDLAHAVGPEGTVEGIDVADAMLTLAQRRCADLPAVRLQLGDATRLDYPDGAFDAAVSVQVMEYIEDVDCALCELARVLRPGGRALVVATDWDSAVWHAADRSRTVRILNAYAEHCPHPHLPCTLGPRLASAGLRVAALESFTLLNTRFIPDTYSHGIMGFIAAFVPGHGGVTQEEAESWIEDFRQREAAGDNFFSLNRYLFLAERA